MSAAVIAAPLSKALGLGAIIACLAAGLAIGPWGLGLVANVENTLHFADFGVVLMQFLVGLELEPKTPVEPAPTDFWLGQGGEFAFVVFQAASGAKAFSTETASLLIGPVAV